MQVCEKEYEKIGNEIEEEQKEQQVEFNEDDDHLNDDIDHEVDLMATYFNKWKINSLDYLNDNDEDEKLENRLYIISIDGIPYFYEKTLLNARNKMWNIANKMLKTSQGSEKNLQILSSNVNEIKIITPYKFFLLHYNHVLFHFTLDYVLPTTNN